MKSTSCESCISSLFSDKQQNLTVEIEELTSTEDIEEGKMFVDSISRGGLVKPSDIMFVTCMHASHLIRYIRNRPSLLRYLYDCTDARSVFLEAFLSKLNEKETEPIMEAKCSDGHEFKTNIKKVIGTMFNIFALNMIRECNNSIHADRKRNNNRDDQKRDQCDMREKKCKSES